MFSFLVSLEETRVRSTWEVELKRHQRIKIQKLCKLLLWRKTLLHDSNIFERKAHGELFVVNKICGTSKELIVGSCWVKLGVFRLSVKEWNGGLMGKCQWVWQNVYQCENYPFYFSRSPPICMRCQLSEWISQPENLFYIFCIGT